MMFKFQNPDARETGQPRSEKTMEESLRLLNGNVSGSLRQNPNWTRSQALPKAFPANRKVDVTEAMK